MIPAGNYKGKIEEYGIKKTQKGDPSLAILFSVEASEGSFHRVFWRGSWNGEGAQHTNKALITMGFTDGRKLPLLANGKSSGLLDTDKIYSLVVDVEPDQKDPTKLHNRVRWINDDSITDTITVQEFGALAGQQELISKFMAYAANKGLKTNSQPAQGNAPDIPF